MKNSHLGKAFLMMFVLLSFAALSFAVLKTYEQSCADGTRYGKCSTASAGKECAIPPSGDMYSAPVLRDNAQRCPCPAGYRQNADACEQLKCSDGTTYNACSRSLGKTWYRCENGALVERASACNCPAGTYLKEGDKCVPNAGCVKNSDGTNGPITCAPEKYCDSEKTNATYNTCVLKAGCQYGNPVCSSSQNCEPDGTCKLKSGCTYNNPGCPSDKICRNNECVARSAFDSMTAGNIANAATPDASSSSLSCCCLPAATALVTLTGAFAIRRKKEE